MRIALIAAVAENGVIGRDNRLPWRLAGDLKRFKEITMGKPLIMGRKTFESIGRPLPGRANIVLSRDPAFACAGVDVARDFESAFLLAEAAAKDSGANEIMVIGGAHIYTVALPAAARIYLTEVNIEASGDARFPPYDIDDWVEVSRELHHAGPEESSDCSFVVLDRIGQ